MSTIEKIICWIIAIPILLLCLIGYLETGKPTYSLLFCGLLFIPRFFEIVEESLIKKKISRRLKFSALIVLFVIGLINFDSGSTSSYDINSTYLENEEKEKCSFCYGEGKVRCTKCYGNGKIDCDNCRGRGEKEVYLNQEYENGLQYVNHNGHSEYVLYD